MLVEIPGKPNRPVPPANIPQRPVATVSRPGNPPAPPLRPPLRSAPVKGWPSQQKTTSINTVSRPLVNNSARVLSQRIPASRPAIPPRIPVINRPAPLAPRPIGSTRPLQRRPAISTTVHNRYPARPTYYARPHAAPIPTRRYFPQAAPRTIWGSQEPVIPNPGEKVPVPYGNAQPCNCPPSGAPTTGCPVLTHFAFGSAELTAAHAQLINDLANTILQQGIKIVTATGHTDTVGTDEANLQLGRLRSMKVVNALRQRLAELRPGANDSIFWKIDTRGESEPVSTTDNGLNRRVTVCFPQTCNGI